MALSQSDLYVLPKRLGEPRDPVFPPAERGKGQSKCKPRLLPEGFRVLAPTPCRASRGSREIQAPIFVIDWKMRKAGLGKVVL